jgi:hypothetical protein
LIFEKNQKTPFSFILAASAAKHPPRFLIFEKNQKTNINLFWRCQPPNTPLVF